jgi:prepilin-type N-terminal cleavage/methylation domain-containing protein
VIVLHIRFGSSWPQLRVNLETHPKTVKSPTRRSDGFTLVELLVAITIIAALAAVIFVLATRMKKSADKSVTVANMRQIGVALIAYNSDQGRFPDQNGTAPNGSPVGTWDRLLIPFMGYTESLPPGGLKPSVSGGLESIARVFATPEDNVVRPVDTYKRSFTLPSWSANYQAPGSSQPPRFPSLPAKRGIPLSIISAPERAAVLVQWYTINNTLGQGAHAYGGIGMPAALLGPFQQVLFADGHVAPVSASMSIEDFRNQYWPKPAN